MIIKLDMEFEIRKIKGIYFIDDKYSILGNLFIDLREEEVIGDILNLKEVKKTLDYCIKTNRKCIYQIS